MLGFIFFAWCFMP